MRILFVAPANSEHTVRWVNSLVARGHEVHLASLTNHKKSIDIDSRVSYHELSVEGMKGYYLNAFRLRKIVKDIIPDVINVHYASGYGTLMRIARLKNAILSVWGSDVYEFPYQNRICHYLIKKNLKYARKVASTSYCMAGQVKRILGKNIDIAITPFGVDLDEYKLKEENHSNEIVIGCVKTLEPKYGMEYLVKGVSLLIDKLEAEGKKDILERICCRIYGDGSQKEKLKKLIDELNLSNYVTLEGKIPHALVPLKLQEMDIFVALSVVDESFGVAAVEAAAVGLPVILSDAAGFTEVAVNDVTGIIVERKSAEAAANALMELVIDGDKRRQLGIAGRKRVEENYDWNKNVDTMVKLYKGLI